MQYKLDHTGFVVKDLDKTIEFYCDVLGFKVLETREREGQAISQVLGYKNVHLKRTYLSSGGGHLLEPIQYISPASPKRPSEERNALGAVHLAFKVDNIEEAYQELIRRGALKLNPPAEINPGRKACYLQDPDHNWIELVEDRV